MKKQLNRFRYAFKGIYFAIVKDNNFKLQVLSGFVFIAVWYVAKPISDMEIMFLVLSYFLILITELQNTSLEEALDRLHPEHHRDIGKSKDMMAGSVLLAGIFAVITVLMILF